MEYSSLKAKMEANSRLEGKCKVWTGARNNKGYGYIRAFDSKCLRVHRLAWFLCKGDIPQGALVLHRCDNPPCWNIEHLWLGTHGDNVRDRVEKGRSASGDRNGTRLHPKTRPRGEMVKTSKLSEAEVNQIRVLHKAQKTSMRILAKRFDVSFTQIWNIISLKQWKHIA